MLSFQLRSIKTNSGICQHIQDAFIGTEKLEITKPEQTKKIPMYRIMDENGNIYDKAKDPMV